jgi:amino acid permease
MTNDNDLKKELEKLKEENEQLKKQGSVKKELTYKVSVKGALSVYGLGRFPVTLYKEQWQRLLEKTDEIKAFISENDSQLAVK